MGLAVALAGCPKSPEAFEEKPIAREVVASGAPDRLRGVLDSIVQTCHGAILLHTNYPHLRDRVGVDALFSHARYHNDAIHTTMVDEGHPCEVVQAETQLEQDVQVPAYWANLLLREDEGQYRVSRIDDDQGFYQKGMIIDGQSPVAEALTQKGLTTMNFGFVLNTPTDTGKVTLASLNPSEILCGAFYSGAAGTCATYVSQDEQDLIIDCTDPR